MTRRQKNRLHLKRAAMCGLFFTLILEAAWWCLNRECRWVLANTSRCWDSTMPGYES
jgi:hypothetical protein